MSITSSAVLVELNISVWTANKLDKGATEGVLISNRATASNAAQVRKNLMAGTTVRKKIADYAGGCRVWHSARTLPWSDRGPRLLPTSLFMDYKSEANVRRDTFNQMVHDFCTNYPNLIETAKNYMGDLFDPNDYPDISEVRSKFDFRLVFAPVPESGDFRLDIPQQELDLVKQEYDASFTERLGEAMRAPWEQLHRLLTTMTTKLTEPEKGDETQRRWHDTFVTNAQDLCAMLTHLNITNDPKLEAARRQLELAMVSADIEDIKEHESSRADLKSKLDTILSGFDW